MSGRLCFSVARSLTFFAFSSDWRSSIPFEKRPMTLKPSLLSSTLNRLAICGSSSTMAIRGPLSSSARRWPLAGLDFFSFRSTAVSFNWNHAKQLSASIDCGDDLPLSARALRCLGFKSEYLVVLRIVIRSWSQRIEPTDHRVMEKKEVRGTDFDDIG